MSIGGPGELTSKAGGETPDGRFLRPLRAVAPIAVVAGAGGSIGLMLRVGQRTPGLLHMLFAIWVLSPFLALLWANRVSKRWSVLTRATRYGVTLVLTLGALAICRDVLVRPPRKPAFPFLVVPFGSGQ